MWKLTAAMWKLTAALWKLTAAMCNILKIKDYSILPESKNIRKRGGIIFIFFFKQAKISDQGHFHLFPTDLIQSKSMSALARCHSFLKSRR